MPRSTRKEGANHEDCGRRDIPYREIACAKILWWEWASVLGCVRNGKENTCSQVTAQELSALLGKTGSAGPWSAQGSTGTCEKHVNTIHRVAKSSNELNLYYYNSFY